MFKIGDACIGITSGITYIILSFKECGFRSRWCELTAECSGKLLHCIISNPGNLGNPDYLVDPRDELLAIKDVCQIRVRLKTEEKEETVP